MKPSEQSLDRAEEILHRLEDRLHPARIVHQIDEPIDQAAATFTWPTQAATAQGLAHVLASVLQHICRQAFPDGEQYAPWRAHDEVIALLQADAHDPMIGGYIGAALDAGAAQDPLWPDLAARITGALKTRMRRQYVQWVLATEIDPHNWSLQCAMTAVLIERMRPYLPPEIAAGPPERWANQLSGLLGMYLGLQDAGSSD